MINEENIKIENMNYNKLIDIEVEKINEDRIIFEEKYAIIRYEKTKKKFIIYFYILIRVILINNFIILASYL